MKTNKLLFSVFFLLLLSVLWLITPSAATGGPPRDRVTTEGEGEAEIQDQNVSQARREALEEALQKAFENALVEILPLDVSLAGRQDILDQLSPGLKKYLLQYRVLSEMPALQVFFLNVEATFSVPSIREDLARKGIAWGREEVGEPTELFVRIEGVSSFRWYNQVLELFRQLAYVNTVTTFEVFGTTLVLRLEYERNLEHLLEAVSSLPPGEFAFRVEQVKDQEITVSLVTTSH